MEFGNQSGPIRQEIAGFIAALAMFGVASIFTGGFWWMARVALGGLLLSVAIRTVVEHRKPKGGAI